MRSLDSDSSNQKHPSRIQRSTDEGEKDGINEVEWQIDDTGEEEVKAPLRVIEKVWTCRKINSMALIDMLKKIWQTKHEIERIN